MKLRLLLVALAALLLPALLPATIQAQSGAGTETLTQLQDTIIPTRDRLELAQRLLGVTDLPAPPTTAPAEYEIGDIETFAADNLVEDYGFTFKAELVAKTDNVYMFVELGANLSPQLLQASAERFQEVIRPKVHEVFGEEWNPGIDGDSHLYIIHAYNLGNWVAAYYDSSSQYPTEAVEKSNEAEMFLVNLDTMKNSVGTSYYEGVLAHEFQHMVHWYVDLNETTWVNEGMSELATMLTGYGRSGFTESFLRDPAIQLNTWPEDDTSAHYGAAFMFMAYFYDRYGEAATSALVEDQDNGMNSVARTLAAINATDPATGEPVNTVDLFADWTAANLLMDPEIGDGRYAYAHPDMETVSPATEAASIALGAEPYSDTVPQWGTHYIRLASSGNPMPQGLQLSFEGSETVSILPTNAHSGNFLWWSNRADESNTRLTQSFDLSNVTSATLDFWTWYFIEDLWDYAYVTVSTDDGQTWTALESGRTTAEDPHGNAYGPGYTGRSGEWVNETIDLTPYAGQVIQVRFEYITDAAVNQPGIAIDDVSIPEIGYANDFEQNNGGWTSEGWLRMDNVLPQSYLVQLIQPGNTDQPVTRLLPAEGAETQGTWQVTVSGTLGDAWLAISGLAPVTTEAAPYTLTLAPAQ